MDRVFTNQGKDSKGYIAILAILTLVIKLPTNFPQILAAILDVVTKISVTLFLSIVNQKRMTIQ